MKLRKLTEAEFNALVQAEARKEETCTKPGKKPTVQVYKGNVPVLLTFPSYDLPIDAGTYEWLVFIPCELIGEHNWIRGFDSRYVVGLKHFGDVPKISPDGPRKPHNPAGEYKIIELENNGVLFAF